MLLKPPRLEAGQTIGVISPASPPPDPKAIDRVRPVLHELGFKTKLARNVHRRFGFLAGTDRQRADDIMQMFKDSAVDAILCVRGGYGSPRLLSRLDYSVIRANPKIFVGFSDITALHCAFLKHANLVSFHGPMLNSHFVKPALPAFTRESFLNVLQNRAAAGSILAGYKARTINILRGGSARGRLLGGNLSLLCSLLGTPFQPNFCRKLLSLEDVD